jgi:hypothetical protein
VEHLLDLGAIVEDDLQEGVIGEVSHHRRREWPAADDV